MEFLSFSAASGGEPYFFHANHKQREIPFRAKLPMNVFISYSRKDAEFVERLKTALEAGKVGVTIDTESLAFGDDLHEFVERSVRETDLTIAVISRNSLQSVWVIAEALETLMYEKVLGRKKYLPIYIDASFLDDALYLQIVEQIDASLVTLKDLTVQGMDRHLDTVHLDQKRDRFITLRNNLPTILKKLADILVADFSSEAKFTENLPKLLEAIAQSSEVTEAPNARHDQGERSFSQEIETSSKIIKSVLEMLQCGEDKATILKTVKQIARNSQIGRIQESHIILEARRYIDDYDVFLCHNSKDKDRVKEIGKQLKAQGILPWLDEWDIEPGKIWLDELDRIIDQVNTVAVFVGLSQTGPWEKMEIRTLLRKFISESIKVIPVILEGTTKEPDWPTFLENFHKVDFRRSEPDPFQQLVWGITGKKNFLI